MGAGASKACRGEHQMQTDLKDTELKYIPNYKGLYAADFYGNIYRCYKKGLKRISPVTKKGKQVIRLTGETGRKEHFVSSMVYRAWVGPIPKGKIIYHKNGNVNDNIASNLAIITRKELGKITGGKSRRKPVLKIDTSGEIVEAYTSARTAAKANHMSYQTIIDRCNGKVKSKIEPDGYQYKWDE